MRTKPEMGTFRALRPLDVIAIQRHRKVIKVLEITLPVVITDVFTRFSQVIPTKNQMAKCISYVIKSAWFYRFWFPCRINSDQSRNFESAVTRDLCDEHGIVKL